MDPRERRTTKIVLVRRGASVDAPRLAARLSPWVRSACLWPEVGRGTTWEHGDYRFLVLSGGEAGGPEAFVQLWCEPHDDVVVEVSSGRFGPLPAFVPSARRRNEALRRHGLALAPRGVANWRKLVAATEEHAADRLAREVAELAVEALGLPGGKTVRLTLCHATRLFQAEVLAFTRIDRVAQMLRDLGCRIESIDERGARLIVAAAAGMALHVTLTSEVPSAEAGTYSGLRLDRSGARPAFLSLQGGVTPRNLMHFLEEAIAG